VRWSVAVAGVLLIGGVGLCREIAQADIRGGHVTVGWEYADSVCRTNVPQAQKAVAESCLMVALLNGENIIDAARDNNMDKRAQIHGQTFLQILHVYAKFPRLWIVVSGEHYGANWPLIPKTVAGPSLFNDGVSGRRCEEGYSDGERVHGWHVPRVFGTYQQSSGGIVAGKDEIGGYRNGYFYPRPLLIPRLVQLSLEYPGGVSGEQCRGDGGTNPKFFKKAAAVFVVILLSALGIKLISNGVDIGSESPNAGLVRIALASVVFAVAIPILLFVVPGWAHP